MLRDFVISDIPWASAEDLRCRIHDATGSMCASRTPSGARSSARSHPSIPSPYDDPPFPKRSATCSSLMPAPCSVLRSRGRRCDTHTAASRTGSAGGWPELSVPPHPGDASRVHEAGHAHDLHAPTHASNAPGAAARSQNARPFHHKVHLAAACAASPNPSTKPGQVQTGPTSTRPTSAPPNRGGPCLDLCSLAPLIAYRHGKG